MVKDNLFTTPSGDRWKRIGTQRRAGLLVPLFSVYSKNSIGIGDLHDLKLLINLCDKVGSSILQLLPMNEAGGTNCPYDAVSSFALEPLYISFEDLPAAKKKDIKTKIYTIKGRFPAGSIHVDYSLRAEKLCLLWDVYIETGDNDSKEFKKFIDKNDYWLNNFVLFKVLKNHYGGKPWYEWEDRYKNRDSRQLNIFQETHKEEIGFQKWLQWTAFNQFTRAKSYAKSRGVLIKGDLPILISRDSADVWAHPEFFKLNLAAGAPQDMYCAKGQRWGMPTYNWDGIAADGYRYLKEKLKFAENFYDILRIDHVVGIFRIWSISYNEPLGNEGLNGFFDPIDENKWKAHGRQILSVMIDSTNILLCAEDLGLIPKICPETLKEFGIPGNDVQRWTKDWKIRHDFLKPQDYRFLSVAMLSTHDTTNWAAWWENEAGTIDEELFIRKCRERDIDYEKVKNMLFNPSRSRRGRLRWLDAIDSNNILIDILGKAKEEVADFIDIYKNTYKEKEKLWKHLNIKGPMREKADSKIVSEVLKMTLRSKSIFCIELLIDYLYLTNIFKGDPYKYRINRPGTISQDNWSLTIPVPLEDLLKYKICKDIKRIVSSSGRI